MIVILFSCFKRQRWYKNWVIIHIYDYIYVFSIIVCLICTLIEMGFLPNEDKMLVLKVFTAMALF